MTSLIDIEGCEMKKNLILISLLLAQFGVVGAYAADPAQAKMRSLADFYAKFKTSSETVWPGLNVGQHPLLVGYDDFFAKDDEPFDDSIYALDFKTKNSAWQKQIWGSQTVYYLPHDNLGFHQYQGDINNAYFDIENQKAVPVLIDEELDDQINNVILAEELYAYHELFDTSNHKAKINLLMQRYNVNYTGLSDLENYSLILLEVSALQDYLNTHNETALKNYVAIFQTRYDKLDAAHKLYEVDGLEFLPASFVGYKAASNNDKNLTDLILNAYRDDFSMGHPDYSMIDDSLYFISTAVSYGLDHTTPGWQMAMEANNTPASVLLAQHYHLSQSEIAAGYKKAKQLYNYEKIYALVNEKISPYVQAMKAEQQAYAQDAGVEITYTDFGGLTYDYRSFSDEVYASTYYTSNHSQISKGDSFKVGGMELQKGGLLLSDWNDDESLDWHTKYRFKIPADAQVKVDGVNYTMAQFVAQDRKVGFSDLAITAGELQFMLSNDEYKYAVKVEGGKLYIVMVKASVSRVGVGRPAAVHFHGIKKPRVALRLPGLRRGFAQA